MIEQLFYKAAAPVGGIIESPTLNLALDGIEKSLKQHSLKQVLLLPRSSLIEFELQAGQLKENIVISDTIDLHNLESGSVLKIGLVKIRLTFHCEPCSKIKHLVNHKKILHKRGYHGQVVQAGPINVGDSISLTNERYAPIPYDFADRVKWYLEKTTGDIWASDLVYDIGLSSSYCRALPNILRNRSDIEKSRILFKNKQEKIA
jgi:hypothetical protein